MLESISKGFELFKNSLGWVWIPIIIVVVLYLIVKIFGGKK